MKNNPKISVLFIDDSPDDVELLVLEFERHNYTIDYRLKKDAQNFQSGLKGFKPDVIIVDYFIPGVEIKQLIQTFKKNTDAPLFVVSNVVEEQVFNSLYKLGVCDFIHKKSLHRLIPTVERELAQIEHKKEIKKLKQEAEKNQEILTEKNRFVQQLIESTSNLIYYKDTQGRYLGCNQAFADFFGKEKTEIIGKKAQDLIQAAKLDFYISKDESLIKSKEPQIFENQLYDGEQQPHDVIFFRNALLNQQNKPIGIVGHIVDISKQKEYERVLKESEERYKLFFDVTFEGILIHHGLKIVDVNNAFLKITGYNKNEIIGKNLMHLVPDDEDAKRITESFKTNTKNPYRIRLKKKEGKIVYVEIETRVEKSNSGEITIVAIRDISKRIQAEKEREFSENKYKLLINQMHEGMGIVGLDETIQFTNPAFNEIFEYKNQELVGKNLKEFVLPDDIHKIIKGTQIRQDGKSDSYKVRIKTHMGKLKTIRVSASPWLNNLAEIVGSIALIMDVTIQDKAKQDLQRRYDFEKYLFQISNRFLTPDNFDENLKESLKEMCKLINAEIAFFVQFDNNNTMGTVTHDFIDKSAIKREQTIHELSLTQFQWGLNKLSTREPLYIRNLNDLPDIAIELKQELIEKQVDNFIGFPVFKGKNLMGFIGIINLKNQAEWDSNEFILLRTVGEELANAIQRKFTEDSIQHLNQQLLAKNKEMEQVIYVTSHDIRSPLVNIIGFSKELNKVVDELNEIIKEDALTTEDKKSINTIINNEIPEIIHFINAGGEKIDRQLSALLKLSRLGRSEIRNEKINPNQLIEQIIYSFKYQLESNQIEMLVDDLLPCHTDKHILNQVFSNLVDNAIKYHDPEQPSYIKIYSQTREQRLFYYFEDNGLGIPEEKRDKVFEIFSRVHHEKAEGEGMGLTIIKKGLERLGGAIHLETGKGKGSIFIVELPAIS